MEQHRNELQAQMQYKQEQADREKAARREHHFREKEHKRNADAEAQQRHQKKIEDVNQLKHHLVETGQTNHSRKVEQSAAELSQDKARNQRAAEAVEYHAQQLANKNEQFKNARLKDVQQKLERNDYEQQVIKPKQKEADQQMNQGLIE